jgi:Ca2+-binding RTX toxin-like protein
MAFLTDLLGLDTLQGGEADDTLMGNDGVDTLDGGGGRNVVAYSTSPNAVGVLLGRGITSDDGFGDTDVLINIQGVFGSGHNDVLIGGVLSDFLVGAGGNDTIEGLVGDDALCGSAGNDRIAGGLGQDTAHYDGSRSDYTITAIDHCHRRRFHHRRQPCHRRQRRH